jgi:hypothetical protein
VTKANEPRGCDWLKAPIGDKDCHYEIQVSTVRTAFDAHGKPIVSFDEGATWLPNDAVPPAKSEVVLPWKKSDDE